MRRRLMAVVMALCVTVSAAVCDVGTVYASVVQTEGTGAVSEGTAQNLETIEGETEITQEQDAGATETGDTEPGETEGTTSAEGTKEPAESEAAGEGTTETEEAGSWRGRRVSAKKVM